MSWKIRLRNSPIKKQKKRIINRKYENMNADLSEMKDTECVNIQVTEGPLSAKQERSTLI